MKQYWAVTSFDGEDPVRITAKPHRSARQAAQEIFPGTNGIGVWVKPLGKKPPPLREVARIAGWRPVLRVVY